MQKWEVRELIAETWQDWEWIATRGAFFGRFSSYSEVTS